MHDWPHSPPHHFANAGTYFITGATLHKAHVFQTCAALDALQATLFANANEHHCLLQAWSLFSNHYHLVVSSERGESISRMLARVHTESAIDVNRRDGVRGRKVWFQFWDTQLTYEGSWLARLKYTHDNAVHHGLVEDARKYAWCSAAWFERTAGASLIETVKRCRTDRVRVADDFAAALLPR